MFLFIHPLLDDLTCFQTLFFQISVRMCSSDKMIPIYFIRLCKVWSIYYITGQWGEFTKKCYFMLSYTFICFSSSNLCFYHFISFSNEISNFCNKILTNQKHELVASNCKPKCMHNTLQILMYGISGLLYVFHFDV